MKTRRLECGFTVVELLIALSIMSLAVITLISALSYARSALTSGENDKHFLEEIALLHRLLLESLGQVIVTDNDLPAIHGSDTTLAVATSAPRILSFMPPPVRFTLQPDSDGHGLLASWKTEAASGGSIDRRIVGAQQRVRFSYFMASAGWVNFWGNRRDLPLAVRADMSRGFAATKTIEVVLPVRAVVSAVCAVQPRTTSCRASR